MKSRSLTERKELHTQFAKKLRKESTDAEALLWRLLRNKRIVGCKFRRQHALGNYVADFICIEAGLIVEVDGGQHNQDENRIKDACRTEELEKRGFTVLRFWNPDVLANPDGVLTSILEFLKNNLLLSEGEGFLSSSPPRGED